MIVKGKELSPSIIIEALLWSIIISAIIRLFSLKTVFRIITPERTKAEYRREIIINSVNAVLYLQTKLFPVKCWKKSMLMFRLLKRHGYEPKMHFGVSITDLQNKNDKVLSGHSWLTVDNSLLFDNDAKVIGNLTEILTYP